MRPLRYLLVECISFLFLCTACDECYAMSAPQFCDPSILFPHASVVILGG